MTGFPFVSTALFFVVTPEIFFNFVKHPKTIIIAEAKLGNFWRVNCAMPID